MSHEQSRRRPPFEGEIKIKDKKIGGGSPCYIVAEAGSNHDRELKNALQLVDIAAEAGCDAVKFQTFTAENIASGYQGPETRLPKEFSRWGKNLREFYQACALPDEFHEPIAKRAKEKKIHFFSSPFSEKDVDRLVKIGVPALKISSFELVHLPLIRYAAQTKLPLILSTGMADLGDIEQALEAVQKGGGKQVALLHCGSSYPLDPSGVHLAAMKTIRSAFGVPVGYSDHTQGTAIPVAAVALGAELFEKHFTFSRQGEGPDHLFSLEPGELKSMVKDMREAQKAIGLPIKCPQPQEEAHAKRGRRSLFAAKNLTPGDKITKENVKILRPRIGLEPDVFDRILGKKVIRPVRLDDPLKWEDFFSN